MFLICFYIYVLQVYVWSKQNPFIHMSFLGLFTFTAAYLPWVSERQSLLVEHRWISISLKVTNKLCFYNYCFLVAWSLLILIWREAGIIDLLSSSAFNITISIAFLQVLLGFSVLVGASAWVDLLVRICTCWDIKIEPCNLAFPC